MSQQAFFVTKERRRFWASFALPTRVYEIGSAEEFRRLGRAYGRFQVMTLVLLVGLMCIAMPLVLAADLDGAEELLLLGVWVLHMGLLVGWSRRAAARLQPDSRLLSELEGVELLDRFFPQASFVVQMPVAIGLIVLGLWLGTWRESMRLVTALFVVFGLLIAAQAIRKELIRRRLIAGRGPG